MTMHAQEIVGARVTSADGQVVGTVEQVFNDDVDGQPVWARVRAGRRNRFVPLGGSRSAADGIDVPFESQRIVSGPEIAADQHMSATQAEQLSRYYGLVFRRSPAGAGRRGGQQAAQDQAAQNAGGRRTGARRGKPGGGAETRRASRPPVQARRSSGRVTPTDHGDRPDWLVRAEERITVGTEIMESGRVRIHKYVDTEPVEQAVHGRHEEYEIEHVPISGGRAAHRRDRRERAEIVLHAERAVMRKETVPVERVRLVTRTVEETTTVKDQIRKERIEVEPAGAAGQSRSGTQQANRPR